MSRLTHPLAVLVAGAAAAMPATASAHAHAVARHRRAPKAVIHLCARGTAVAPRSYVLSCGDGGTGLVKLHWTHWGERTATATGRAFVNTCTPTCVAGHYLTYPVKVTVSHLSGGAYHLIVVADAGKRPGHGSRPTAIRIGRRGPETSLIVP